MRLVACVCGGRSLAISIHAPLAGCDLIQWKKKGGNADISIHAPLAGCDQKTSPSVRSISYFNPRTPCGVRPVDSLFYPVHLHFNPRTPCGVRPYCNVVARRNLAISIHAPLAGCDGWFRVREAYHAYFNPRTPCGVRRSFISVAIHSP